MRRVVLFALFLATPLTAQPTTRRALTIADWNRLQSVSDPQRSPDGAWVAYTVSQVDSTKDRHQSDVWMTSWDGATTLQLTTSDASESSPRWSPDGKYIAFLSKREGTKASQVWLLNRAGGEAQRISDLKGGVNAMAWSPDSHRMVLVAGDPDPADSSGARPIPIVVDQYQFKRDGQGYLDTLHSHLYLLDVATHETEQITSGAFDDGSPAWSPDGSRIAFVSERAPDADRYANSDVYVIDAKAGATPTQLTTYKGSDEGSLSWSADGRRIAYVQGATPKDFGYGGGIAVLAVVPAAGGATRLLTETVDRPVSSPHWAHSGTGILAVEANDRREYVIRVDTARGTIQRVSPESLVVRDFSEGTAGSGIAVLASTPTSPGEIYAVDQDGMRQLTHFNTWLDSVALSTVTGVTSTSDDGTEVHGILRMPAGAAPGRPLPLIVRIHGGPAGQDAFAFSFENELLAAQGWAILSPNYRGSAGRGTAYTLAIAGDWCNKEVRDIHGMVDHLVATGVADSSRLGVGGWSYGGILTDCLIAADMRFKAATSGAGVADLFGMYGHDQYVVQYDLELGQPWKNVARWMKVSKAFFHADQIRTPTLFLGGSLDANVPVLGGEQMYQALKSLRIPTELIVYPGETHGIRRPSFQRDRLERYVAWYHKYLGTPVPQGSCSAVCRSAPRPRSSWRQTQQASGRVAIAGVTPEISNPATTPSSRARFMPQISFRCAPASA